ncbi:MAG: 50S ribosomal protein L17 [Candidatus Giovannonibacteria bacterium GW2011_GWB1_46_20]|nr:MAG: 50S ribosomal protein L17 [Parcubacteria group bacterium GW2011_GWC1_44_10]KKT60005.1 MAG: 50S ribosomal protein L17 [Candidatus Giovannonibacteria bacterium GW2011_GWA1_44_25]KKU30123.1 MAG: 50S ribosomal protein L17 [Candidatus Giovannonibacteria bacterium GW2011_GWB1_46_20]
MKGKIRTTLARAKELRSTVEGLVTHVKRHAAPGAEYREIRKFLPKAAAGKLVKEIAPKHKDRNGGYTRIIKLLPRSGDAAKMAFIEFV